MPTEKQYPPQIPENLPHETLVQILTRLQRVMYYDDVRCEWDMGKDYNPALIWEVINEEMIENDLCPVWTEIDGEGKPIPEPDDVPRCPCCGRAGVNCQKDAQSDEPQPGEEPEDAEAAE